LSKLKDKILELRNLGYSYKQIEKIADCSRGTVSYHCGLGQKEKAAKRQIEKRAKYPIDLKISNFRFGREKKATSQIRKNNTLIRILNLKLSSFFCNKKKEYNKSMAKFGRKELLEKIGDNPKCAMTGKPINLWESSTYSLDHIVPRSKGGDNSLENCQLVCRQVNKAKTDMSVEEFISLCEQVVKYKEHMR
jgi:5-methylcytosine-specific restriction endonuclease McrA